MNHSQLLNPVAAAIPPSGIRKFFDILDEMEDVISLTVGEPDFVTPWGIRAESIRSLEHGHTHYTSNIGLLELRKQIAAYQSRRFGLSYDPEHELLVTVGGSEASAMAAKVSMMRFTQSIWVTVSGDCVPRKAPASTTRQAHTLTVVWKSMKRWMF